MIDPNSYEPIVPMHNITRWALSPIVPPVTCMFGECPNKAHMTLHMRSEYDPPGSWLRWGVFCTKHRQRHIEGIKIRRAMVIEGTNE